MVGQNKNLKTKNDESISQNKIISLNVQERVFFESIIITLQDDKLRVYTVCATSN